MSSKRPLPLTLEPLEDRRLMSVDHIPLPNASVNDTVYDATARRLYIVFYDTQSKSLKSIGLRNYQPGDPIELVAPVTIDATEGAGQYLSTALGADGVLHVAYYDPKNGDLKYAHSNPAGGWSTTTVDSKNTVGLYPSIALDRQNRPAISYYSKSGGNLKVAALRGSTWKSFVVDARGDAGRYSSLALDLDERHTVGGVPFGFAYLESTTGHFRYADVFFQNAPGDAIGGLTTRWAEVDSTTPQGGGYISLAFNGVNPAFSYYDAANADLKYAERSAGGIWSTTAVAANNSQGLYSDLSFTFDTDQPAIVYYNKSADRTVLAYRKPDQVWNFETLVTGGGRNLSAADGPVVGNTPPDLYLLYTDSATGNLVTATF
jgi:hypothetical protein